MWKASKEQLKELARLFMHSMAIIGIQEAMQGPDSNLKAAIHNEPAIKTGTAIIEVEAGITQKASYQKLKEIVKTGQAKLSQLEEAKKRAAEEAAAKRKADEEARRKGHKCSGIWCPSWKTA